MSKLKLLFPDFPFHSLVCLICVIALIGLGAYGIWCPPQGDITDNLLKFLWMLVFVITIFQVRPIIRECGHIRFTKGDATLEAGKNNEPTPEDK